MFTGSAMIGFGQGFQPVCGFNYGAGRYDRVKRAFLFCVKVSTVFLLVLSVVGILAAPLLIELFQKGDAMVLEIGTPALRAQLISLPLIALTVMANMMLQTTGKVGRASFLATARQGLVFIPALLLLSRVFELWGILLTQCVSDIISFACALPITIGFFRECGRQQSTL